MDVAVTDLKTETLAETLGAITGHGRKGAAIALDVRSIESIDAAIAETVATFGRIDVLVNNAGVPLSKPALEVRSEEHTSELQSLMRISYAVFCLKKKK